MKTLGLGTSDTNISSVTSISARGVFLGLIALVTALHLFGAHAWAQYGLYGAPQPLPWLETRANPVAPAGSAEPAVLDSGSAWQCSGVEPVAQAPPSVLPRSSASPLCGCSAGAGFARASRRPSPRPQPVGWRQFLCTIFWALRWWAGEPSAGAAVCRAGRRPVSRHFARLWLLWPERWPAGRFARRIFAVRLRGGLPPAVVWLRWRFGDGPG